MLTEEPLGGLVVPYKSMTTHWYFARCGKFQIRLCFFKAECRFKIVSVRIRLAFILIKIIHGLHIVFAGEAVKLGIQQLHICRCMQILP